MRIFFFNQGAVGSDRYTFLTDSFFPVARSKETLAKARKITGQ
jgi:hypothetical protein